MAVVQQSVPCIALDLSRLVYAGFSRTPTGIPRVELAYAEYFIARTPAERLRFVVVDALGRFRLVPNRLAVAYVRRLAAYWARAVPSHLAYLGVAALAHAIHAWLLVDPVAGLRRLIATERCLYIIPSQLHLEKTAAIRELKDTGNLKLVYVVHDVLPSLLPEYFPPDAEARNRRRMETAARHADLIIANSQATARSFEEHFGKGQAAGTIIAAPIGITVPRPAAIPAASGQRPYFVTIGTLEPRKNHLLLLTLWRSLRESQGEEAAPRLILIGGRGWQNENAVEMLERSAALRGLVEERRLASDDEAAGLLQGARALLLPSFAEGFGMPLAESLALKVPVICSDIPAFREVGNGVPDYLDPIDGPAWRAAILDYASPDSARRAAQMQRLAGWQQPTWERHFALVQPALDALTWP